MPLLISIGYIRSLIEGAKMLVINFRFLKMKKKMMGMTTVKMKMGKMVPFFCSKEL